MDEKKKEDVEAFVSGLVGQKVEMPYLTDEVEANVHRALESFEKEDRSFNCIACGGRFTPAQGQWIFHELCNKCFPAFDWQKMCGRLPARDCKHTNHFQSAKQWAIEMQKQFIAYLGPEIARIEAGGDLPKRFEGQTREACLESMRAELQHFKALSAS